MSALHFHSPIDDLTNPVIRPRRGQTGVRDPALYCHDGVVHCFYTATWWDGDHLVSTIEQRRSIDLQHWSDPAVIGPPTLCSPGNVLAVDVPGRKRFQLVCQHYPMTLPIDGRSVYRHDCRLWILESDDLVHWSDPRIVVAAGSTAPWSSSPRQIDPCIIDHDGRFWMLYKEEGGDGPENFGLLVSDDLVCWQEAALDGPVIGPHNMPEGLGVENPMILRDGEEFVCFFAPCHDAHKVGVGRSRDLLGWYDLELLDLPQRPWLHRGHNAPCVIDMRPWIGKWLMAFHSCGVAVVMGGRIGLAWSDDLRTWELT
ncbi:MAG: hypothetical protein ACOCVS_03335 [Planctomycetota bacterium]